MKVETEAKIQMIGFSILLALSLIVTYNDIIRFKKVIGIKKINIQDNNKSNRNIKAYNQIYDVLNNNIRLQAM